MKKSLISSGDIQKDLKSNGIDWDHIQIQFPLRMA